MAAIFGQFPASFRFSGALPHSHQSEQGVKCCHRHYNTPTLTYSTLPTSIISSITPTVVSAETVVRMYTLQYWQMQ